MSKRIGIERQQRIKGKEERSNRNKIVMAVQQNVTMRGLKLSFSADAHLISFSNFYPPSVLTKVTI